VKPYLVVFFGSGLGGMFRHGVNVIVARWLGIAFPYSTVVVNILGSMVLGLLAGYFAVKADPGQSWRLFLTTGILGGFTTFSAFSLDTVLFYERGQIALGIVYVMISVLASAFALFAGLILVRGT
jgi:CrcB protein